MTEQIPQLRMVINDLSGWSFDEPLTAGFSIRTYHPGDEEHWCLIISESFHKEFNQYEWQRQILGREGFRPERIFFIFDDSGVPCATASAMRIGGEQHGYVHYVGTRPTFAGKKLGYHATAAVTQSFQREGCLDAALDTDPERIPAICVYLKLGYRPLVIHEKHQVIWDDIRKQIGINF